ncbi:MAG TPA: acetyltransferase [Hydrogenophaga sp.]|nr:MAG: hypothetical protein A2X73_08625 [Burkholderiales bacterium GWE1_65_30]OGA92512.1 MAG: hypothetical protein A2X72_18615 [Burkholderiales bacterium GWF1_66_17]HAX22551.1 acetyltransferase [Hydrogenophaga sp.]HBU18094.1 acetyltransferase [Hydrogenophaga sp.]
MRLDYLWRNRERPNLFSKRWFVVWVKRSLTSVTLLEICFAVWKCKFRGGKVGSLSIINRTPLSGKLSNLNIGESTYIAKTVNIALHEKVTIGSFVSINDGVQILTASHDLNSKTWNTYAKEIKIGDFAWIASNAILLPGVTIGRGAVIGAGAVVRKDVPDGHVMSGNPALKVAERCTALEYSPVKFFSPYEAWLGSGKTYEN